jgi:hypothetical protein
MKKIILLPLSLLFLMVATDAFAAVRCGRQIVQTGAHRSEVLQKCGEPEYADERLGIIGNRLRHPRGTLEIERYETVVIEEWIYNFGPRKFKQLLVFENGILTDVYDLDYGY